MAASSLTTILSTKGQVILPKPIRDLMRWVAGMRLEIEQTDEGVLLKRQAPLFPPTRPDDVFGCLAGTGEPKSIEDMNAAIAEETKRRHARGRY